MSRVNTEPRAANTNLAEFHDGLERASLVAQIQQHLNERFEPYSVIADKAAYISAAHTLPDTATEYFYILAKTGVKNHHWLWLHVLHRLSHLSGLLLRQRKQLAASSDIHISSATAMLSSFWQQVARHAETFFDAVDVAYIVSQNAARGLFLAGVNESICLCTADQVFFKHPSLISSAALAVSRYYRAVNLSFSKNPAEVHRCKVELAPTLVELGKVSFIAGVPQAINPLVFCGGSEEAPVSESFLPSILLDPAVTLPLMSNYYKYYAFCLVTLLVENSVIDEALANKADIFLRVLLAFPHLSLTNYMAEALSTANAVPETQPRMISSVEREEIAFFFLLNYLLRMRSLDNFVDPHPTFVSERRFFVASFNKRCGAELDFSASASSSRTGSVVSMTRMADHATALANSPHVTLSCVLSEGTYKEKVRLVAEFINLTAKSGGAGSIKRLVETFDLSSLHHRTNQFSSASHDVSRIFHRIDPQQFPGKVLYVKALDMIVRLLQLLALKKFSAMLGSSSRPADFLASLFKTNYSLRDVLSVKELLEFDGNDAIKVHNRPLLSEEDMLSRQFRLLEATNLLKTDLQKLI